MGLFHIINKFTNIQNITSNLHQHDYLFFTSKIPRSIVIPRSNFNVVDRRGGMIAAGLDSHIRVDISVPKPYPCGIDTEK